MRTSVSAIRQVDSLLGRLSKSRFTCTGGAGAAVVIPSSRRPSSRSAWITQLRIDCADGSHSRASWSGLRPDRTSSTIWRRNSAGYGGLDRGIVDTSSSKDEVSTKPGQAQTVTSSLSMLRSSALAVAGFAACLALGTAVHLQTNTTGRLDPSDAAQLRALAERGHAGSAFQLGVTYMESDPAEAVKWIRLAAEHEHAEAQAMLGRLYYVGHGVPKDYSETLRWYRRAVEQNNPRAQFYLGLMYYNGHGVPKDESEAVKWIRRAADQGDVEAQMEVGGIYSVGVGDVPQDYAEAAHWYTRAADQGWADAQFLLWLYHHEGRGVPKDPVEAARWLRMAAEQGHADAQFKLGTLYIEGDGVPEDGTEAVRWLHRAAQQGHAQTLEMFGTVDELDATLEDVGGGSETQGDARFNQLLGAAEGGDAEAQYELAVAYAEGRVDVDDDERKEQALLWWTRAASQGHAGAMAELGSLYMGTDDVMALRWLRPAAEEGHGGAQINLGHMYAEGLGVPKDDAEAARLFRLAAEQGFAQAQYNLGVMYLQGQGVPKDTAEAVRWFRLAADQGHPDAVTALRRTEPTNTLPSSPEAAEKGDAEAQYSLGQRYDYGLGVEEDDAEAGRWYRLAAEQGHAEAQHSLGLRYALGQGVEKDDAEAVRWYRLAAEQGHGGAQFLLGNRYEIGSGVERDFNEAVRWYRLAAENGHDDAAELIESLETWRCFDRTDLNRTNVLLTLTRLENGGEVSVAGTTYSTQFEVRGLDRRWDFGLDDNGSYDYMFRIEPDGTGLYYDFSLSTDGTAKPSQTYECEVQADR